MVAPGVQGRGIGRELVTALLAQAAELELPQVFALTRKTAFFLKLGFQVAPRESLPRKIWKDCITCTKFVGCDEVAVVRPVDNIEGLEDWKTGGKATSNGNGKIVIDTPLSVIQPSTPSAFQSIPGDGYE